MSASLLLTSMGAAEASNLNFLNDTPMSYIKKNDIDAIKVALTEVLNTKRDGEATQWTNQDTGNSVKIDATMTPENTRHEGNKTCRRVTVVLSAKGQSMNLHPAFCGTGGKDWTLQRR
ncbi:RT0821/Lpp0805 family surface protein [Paraburkholderia caribensis]|nr:RT0821/Lpp0805 family surface protein [Paraburkholderia caribensis]